MTEGALGELQRSRQQVTAAEERLRREIAELLHGRVQSRLIVAWHRLGQCQRLGLARSHEAQLPPGADGFGRDVQRIARLPFADPSEGLHEDGLRADHRGLRGQPLDRRRQRQVEDCAQDDAPSDVLRHDGRSFERGGTPRHLLRLLEHALEQFGPAEGRLPRRLLKGQHCRAELVTQPGEQVLALLVDQPLADLEGLPGRAQPRPLRPAHQPAVQDERFPRPARRREVAVGRSVPPVIRHMLHATAHANPHGRSGAHTGV